MATDKRIKKNIVDILNWDDRVDASNVRVEVKNGIVKLKGLVRNDHARRAAHTDASGIAGVRKVENDIVVSPEVPPDIPNDEEIESRIRNILQWNAVMDLSQISVNVNRGWVTLQGAVSSYWKKIQAEIQASQVRGVVGVANELAVVPSGEYHDQAIADQIVAALDREASMDPENIDVKVEDGVVTLSGWSSTWPELQTAERIARNTAGVRDIVNHLEIANHEQSG